MHQRLTLRSTRVIFLVWQQGKTCMLMSGDRYGQQLWELKKTKQVWRAISAYYGLLGFSKVHATAFINVSCSFFPVLASKAQLQNRF
ncbi:hypothetical protein ACE6H2_011728 [Prunus campanulata]